MECVSGENNWKLIYRREGGGVTLLRAHTCDRTATLPSTIEGLPVLFLGDHALCPDAGAVPGREKRVTCGIPKETAAWDNRQLTSLTLPRTLRRVGDYALFNCSVLETLHLEDSVTFWGGSALMNCRKLHSFFLTRSDLAAQGESLAYFADELSRELDVTILSSTGVARLLFPEYQERYEENCPAHHFDYNIYGAGYPYHHCFRQKQLSLRGYDGLWRTYLGMEYDPDCALRLAFYRLRYPLELTSEARADYLAYLRAHAAQAILWLLGQRDAAGLAFLLRLADPSGDTLAQGCEIARRSGDGEALALLLEEQHRRFPCGVDKMFEL